MIFFLTEEMVAQLKSVEICDDWKVTVIPRCREYNSIAIRRINKLCRVQFYFSLDSRLRNVLLLPDQREVSDNLRNRRSIKNRCTSFQTTVG